MTPTQRRMRDLAEIIGREIKRNEKMPLWHPFHMTLTHDSWRLIRRALNRAASTRSTQR